MCLGSLASRSTWLATLGMAVAGFCVLFAGVVSSVFAAATVSMLLSFILAVSIRVPASAIPDRLAGWALAGAASLPAILFLWPAPVTDRLRDAAGAACRAHGRRLRAEAEYLLAGTEETRAEREAAVEAADAAAKTLSTAFLATPYRPAGLGSAARAVVRLVDELRWLQALLSAVPRHPHTVPPDSPVLAVKLAAAAVLEHAADLLERPSGRVALDVGSSGPPSSAWSRTASSRAEPTSCPRWILPSGPRSSRSRCCRSPGTSRRPRPPTAGRGVSA